jgi:very-short-patch-repair endonuclease
MSPPEAKLWNMLRREPFAVFHFRRQVPMGPYYADFVCHRAKLVIEVDGASHSTDAAIVHDSNRTAYLAAHGYKVLRFTSVDIFGSLDGVATAIFAEVEQSAPIPPS